MRPHVILNTMLVVMVMRVVRVVMMMIGPRVD